MDIEFNKDGFMTWIREEFPGVIDNHWNFDLVENLIDYGIEHKGDSKDQLCHWISDMLPEVEVLEVARFMKDGYLTSEKNIDQSCDSDVLGETTLNTGEDSSLIEKDTMTFNTACERVNRARHR